MSLLQWSALAAATLLAGFIAAVSGTGAGVFLLVILTHFLGVRIAVPLYALVQCSGNISRLSINHRHIRWPIVLFFVLGAIPAALAGAWLFTRTPDGYLLRILGAFLLISVVVRRCIAWQKNGNLTHKVLPLWVFTPVGAVFALISATVGSGGPILAPFYISAGVLKNAYIGTEALATGIMQITKILRYQQLGVIPLQLWLTALGLAPLMLLGAYLGSRSIARLHKNVYVAIVDGVVCAYGIWFIFS